MPLIFRIRITKLITLVLASVLITSCDSTGQNNQEDSHRTLEIVLESPLDNSSTNSLLRAYNPDNLNLEVLVDGVSAATVRLDDGSYQVNATAANSPFNLVVNWSETVDQVVLQLASYQGQIDVQEADRVLVSESDYQSTSFDNDKDGDSNLSERENNTSPFNSNYCSRCRTDVDTHINRILPSEAPTIDGVYDAVWNKSQFKDTNGDLFISELDEFYTSVPLSTYYENGESPFRWAVMHDGTYLYVLVLGEKAGRQTPYRDNGDDVFQDDYIHVGLGSDDLVNGYIFALLDQNGNPTSTSSFTNDTQQLNNSFDSLVFLEEELLTDDRFFYSEDLGIEVATCLCSDDQSIWEIRIPLPFGLTEGDIFLINVSAFDDVDGGFVDVAFDWKGESSMYAGRAVLNDR